MVNEFITKDPRMYSGERTISSINGYGETGSHMLLDHYIQKLTQNGLNLYIRPEIINLLEENRQ